MGCKRGWQIAFVFWSIGVASAQKSIIEIEVNQALGRQLNGNLYFVEGKDTAIRVRLDTAAQIDPNLTSLAIRRDGKDVVTLAPANYDGATDTVDFLCPSRTACGSWAAGSYIFAATVNGVKNSTEAYDFVSRIGLRILVRPVKANYNGVIT